jgi:arginase family enzyme
LDKIDNWSSRGAIARLIRNIAAIHIHFDVDALDASEVVSMWLTAPGGPTRTELAAALQVTMNYPKISAFGIADINPEKDKDGQTVQAALAILNEGITGTAG